MTELLIRQAEARDIEALCALLFEHGPNPWNHLPEAEVRAHLQAIADGSVQAVLAERGGQRESGGEPLGMVSYRLSRDFARYQPEARREQPHAYICEAVVHRAAAGQGLGARLLKQTVENLAGQGVEDIYIDRHEENAASAGMMRKAGFVELETFPDPARRPNGSGRTTVCCLRLPIRS
ncbi:GNAT family N-acetyltransferase [Pseudomonas lalucatii]|uniref:GNAT family N-acetyltransferase n=1 Tax=Pseudomonas lalucatii TaxID=1424203 RepID=A0ABS5PZT7_9PSED|nr:GNAT family N-acetyltransferase [Pseudomonas lalucatii]MBS7661409.1 GNAT family N-acetyltransferase [Pseudomonas lalucatii]MBS7724105.1 GNAT family N-acetyltransferase [Pseudomonas lalucatii]QVM87892.1 GNAT family N-acetyltransferase [Pseudomonas lalucatii]